MFLSVDIVDSEEWHIERIAANMRSDDVREIWASHRSLPAKALRSGLRSQRCWTAMIEGKPAVMFGVCDKSILTRTGIPWLLATDELSDIKRQFLTYSKEYIEKSMKGYDLLENHVHVDNKLSIRWLKWIGFSLVKKEPYGIQGELFWHFQMRNN